METTPSSSRGPDDWDAPQHPSMQDARDHRLHLAALIRACIMYMDQHDRELGLVGPFSGVPRLFVRIANAMCAWLEREARDELGPLHFTSLPATPCPRCGADLANSVNSV